MKQHFRKPGAQRKATRLAANLIVGQTVQVRYGALADMRGILLQITSKWRCLVRLDEFPSGVYLEIDGALLIPIVRNRTEYCASIPEHVAPREHTPCSESPTCEGPNIS